MSEYVKNWDEIHKEFEKVEHMSCKPGFRRLPNGFITDENQSVKWNRDQVELNHKKYDEEVAMLNRNKNNARDALMNNIYERIQYDVGYGITRKAAKNLWQYAYEIGSGFGFDEIKSHLFEIMDLVRDILKGRV